MQVLNVLVDGSEMMPFFILLTLLKMKVRKEVFFFFFNFRIYYIFISHNQFYKGTEITTKHKTWRAFSGEIMQVLNVLVDGSEMMPFF
jgi:hypothetical protein